MDLIDRAKYRKDLLYAYDDVSMEFDVLDNQPTVNAIPIQKDATNGDMIKAMFPNAQIDYHEKSDLVDRYVIVYIKDCDTCQDYSYDWWNAPYRESEG